MTSTLLRNKYSKFVRAVTLVFVLLMLVAPALHHHHAACCADALAQHHHHASVPGVEPATTNTEDDCILCLWLTEASYDVAKPIVFFFVSLTATALLLIFVRVTALCNAPQPRRIPRAPPVFCAI